MKAKLLTLVMVVIFSTASKAQSNQNVLPVQQSTEITAQNTNSSGNQSGISNTIANETKSPVSQSNPIQNQTSDQKKNKNGKGKIKTWQYIVGGVIVVAIVVFAIIAPNGYNSRSGI
jgi:cytoskeletal protein RodZ